MTRCRQKLQSQRGASIIFALVIFLIASMFSMTMINGALSTAQNMALQHRDEQTYLTVTSAARLFCREAGSLQEDIIADGGKWILQDPTEENPIYAAFLEIIQIQTKEVRDLTMKAPETGGNPVGGFQDVTVKLTKEEESDTIQADFYIKDGGSLKNTYYVTAYFTCSFSPRGVDPPPETGEITATLSDVYRGRWGN